MFHFLKHIGSCLFLLGSFCKGNYAQQADSLVSQEEIDFMNSQIDSLPLLIASGKAFPSQRPCRLDGHMQYYWYANGRQVNLPKEAVRFKGKTRSIYSYAVALRDKASHFYEQKNYADAYKTYLRALDMAVANGFDFEELHGLRPAINNSCFLAGDYEMAMNISTDGLALSEKIGDQIQAAHFNNVIGYIHMKQGNFSESAKYYQTYLTLARQFNDSLSIAHAYLNLADLANAEKQYEKAISYLQSARNIYEILESNGRFNESDRAAFVANKMGESYKLKGEFVRALPFVLTATKIIAKDSVYANDYDEASYFINAGDIYNRLHKPDSAIYYLEKGYSVAHRIIHREYMRDAYQQLAISWSQKGDYKKAYAYQDLFSKLKDSIIEESGQREIYQREAALQLERQGQLQQAALQRQRTLRNISIGIALFVLLTAVFLYNRYRLKQKNRYQKELNRQQVELFNAIAATQDQERKRIAQDIHDSLGSVLSAAKLKLAEVREAKPEMAKDDRFLTGINLLDEASAELRNISHNIMPATLSKLGLVPALKNLCEKISSHKLRVNFSAHEFDKRIDEQTEISIYRIILELINNIVKHASATEANIQLLRYPDHINITVEDDGKGFDPDRISQEKKGIGLGNVFSRVDFMKGAINIDAREGRGTSVIIDIPVPA